MLELQEQPWLVWLVGGLFVASGLFVALRSTDTLFGVAFAVLGSGLVLGFARTVTCTFDLDARRFTRMQTGLFRRRQSENPIDAIVGVRLEQGHGSHPSQSHRIALVLSSGERVPLTTSYSTGKDDKEQIAAGIREFLNLTDPGDVPLPGFGDMVRMMFDPQAARRLSTLSGGVLAEHEEAVRRDPNNVESRRQLATALVMQNRPDEARTHLVVARKLVAHGGHAELVTQFDAMIENLDAAVNRWS